jgi:hypothetical protein
MSVEQELLDVFKVLPYGRQQEVLDFAQYLRSKEPATPQPRKSLYGLWADSSAPPITAEDIDEARREMWGNFPREDI